MENLINILSLAFFLSEMLLFLLKRSKKSEVKVRRDKSSAMIFWTVIPLSIFFAGYFSSYFTIMKNYAILGYTGILLFVFGFTIRWAAIFQLKKAFTVDVAITKDHQIKKDGLYKMVRHPSYLGLTFEFFALSILFDSWASLLLINIPIFMAMLYRMKIEEELLLNTFGSEYENYMKQTKRLLPGIY